MAREPEKSGRESGKARTEGSSEAGGAKSAAGAGGEKTGQDKGGKASIAEYQGERHKELQAALSKRSEDGADFRAIVEEFAAVWLPHHMIEVDLMVPALEDAEVDEDKMAAVAVRKDMLNMLLADLIHSGAVDGAKAKLDALSDTLDAIIAASQLQTDAMGEASDESRLNALGPEMKARYERMKNRFADIDEAIEEAMDLLAPQSLSVSSARRRGRREGGMSRYGGMRDRDEMGRFAPEDERGYSRRRGGYRERDEEGRFMSEGRRSRGRNMDEDEGRYGGSRGEQERGEEGRFMSEGRRSRSRNMDEDEGRYGGARRFMGREYDEDERRYGNRDRGPGGWYGDREGHSEASRRGWSERREEDDEGRYRSRPRYEDEDRRYESRRYEDDNERYGRGGRSRGSHGGWSGDSRGHSEAARKGWEHRR